MMGNISTTFWLATTEKDVAKVTNTIEEPIGGNKLERLVVVAIENQPSRHSYHIAYIDQVIELGKHKEKGSISGN